MEKTIASGRFYQTTYQRLVRGCFKANIWKFWNFEVNLRDIKFESLVSEELSELLSDSSKLKLLKDKKIDDNLDIYSELKSLFDENCIRDEENFWNLGRASSLSFIKHGKSFNRNGLFTFEHWFKSNESEIL